MPSLCSLMSMTAQFLLKEAGNVFFFFLSSSLQKAYFFSRRLLSFHISLILSGCRSQGKSWHQLGLLTHHKLWNRFEMIVSESFFSLCWTTVKAGTKPPSVFFSCLWTILILASTKVLALRLHFSILLFQTTVSSGCIPATKGGLRPLLLGFRLLHTWKRALPCENSEGVKI